jgi:hypothetical protein
MSVSLKAFAHWKLEQKRYKDGLFIVSQLADNGKVTALDARYFVEETAGFVPTRQGFRVYPDMFGEVIRLLRCNPRDVSLFVLRKVKQRTLFCSFCDDKYGTGMDFRYYKHTPDFEGPERRGIRLTLNDFERLKSALTESEAWRTSKESTSDLFQTKPILVPKANTETATAPVVSHSGDAFVDPGITSLIESL